MTVTATLVFAHMLASLALATYDPSQVDDYVLRADAMLQRGEPSAALQFLEAALRLDPDHIDALYGAALLHLNRENYPAAIDKLKRIIQLDSAADDARLDLARAYWRSEQWDASQRILNDFLARHPTSIDGLELKENLKQRRLPPDLPTHWKPLVRASVGNGYDSNVALDPGTITLPGDRRAVFVRTEFSLGVFYDTPERPFTVFAHLGSTTSWNRRDAVDALLPTWAGLVLIARHNIGALQLGIDSRYDELFTNMFSTHRQRSISPAVYASYALGSFHRLRLLTGFDYRDVTQISSFSDNGTAKVVLRDQMNIDRLMMFFDLGGRRNFGIGTQVELPENTDPQFDFNPNAFHEVYASAYGQYRLFQPFEVFALLDTQARAFFDGPKETTYRAQVGARYALGTLEFYADYAFSKNLSNAARTYSRHEVGAGVRFWYD